MAQQQQQSAPAYVAPAVQKQQLAQLVQREVKHVMQAVISGLPSFGAMNEDEREKISKQVQHALVTMMQRMMLNGQLGAYQISKVEVDGHKPFYEVTALPDHLAPGDPYIVINDAGEEEYQGIILACDGKGWGLILSERVEATGAVKVTCTVKPNFPLEYISIQVVQD